MKICPHCDRCYEDADLKCSVDGTTLVPARLGTRAIADGKYRLDRLLGRGGMGAVYAGTHVELERPVAIKLLLSDFTHDPQALERLRHEARAAAKLNHTNIADTYDYGTLPEGGAYIVMELIEGKTLRERFNDPAPLPYAEALLITRQVALGVEAAHRRGIIHRDLKPANIMLTQNEHDGLIAVVLDFGIAKLKEQTHSGGLTNSGMLIGTPRYMSPEQCAGSELDLRSDIYSLGVVLYEMIARRPPFDAPSATAIALKHMHEQPPPLTQFRPDVPAGLAALCMRTLSKNPSARPQTAAELETEISELQRQIGDVANAVWQPSDATTRLASIGAVSIDTSLARSATANTRTADVPPSETGRTNVPTVEELRASESRASAPPPLEGSDSYAARNSNVAVDSVSAGKASGLGRVAAAGAVVFTLAAAVVFLMLWRSAPNESVSQMDDSVSTQPPPVATTTHAPQTQNISMPSAPLSSDRQTDGVESLRTALNGWVAATNRRDIASQMSLYAPQLQRYYRTRNVSRAAVETDKRRLFENADSISMNLGAIQINVHTDGRAATTRFHKRYTIDGQGSSRSGEVVQELDWELTADGWRITSERDVRVIG